MHGVPSRIFLGRSLGELNQDDDAYLASSGGKANGGDARTMATAGKNRTKSTAAKRASRDPDQNRKQVCTAFIYSKYRRHLHELCGNSSFGGSRTGTRFVPLPF